jgi:hypothetical protein
MTDTPGVALGNSDNVQQQDQLTIMGFLANADVSPKPQAFLTSSISSVNVSSKKTSDSGATQLQIDRHIDDSNNGAAALNSQGEIVGVVSASSSNGNSSGDTSFLQASSSAQKLARSINLDMTPGSFQKQWSQAFEDYAATTPGHWHKAEREFTQLAQSYPNFKAVQPLLNYAQTQARTESANPASATPTQAHNTGSSSNSATSSGLAPWQVALIIIGAVLLLFVLGVTLFSVSVRKREGKSVFRPNAAGAKGASTIAKPKSSESPIATGQSPASGETGQGTLTLKLFPCGHMNRSGARFCNVCGEPGPEQ